MAEKNILQFARNPFVINLLCSFATKESLYLVMEYAPGGDLAALIQELGVLTLVEARRYFAEIVRCTASCMSGRWKEDGWAKGGG